MGLASCELGNLDYIIYIYIKIHDTILPFPLAPCCLTRCGALRALGGLLECYCRVCVCASGVLIGGGEGFVTLPRACNGECEDVRRARVRVLYQ